MMLARNLADIAVGHLVKKIGTRPEIIEHLDLNLVNKIREQISNCTNATGFG